MCGSEGVQTELVGDEGGDDEGGRVEVEVEGYPRVESLHRGGCRLARRWWSGGWAGCCGAAGREENSRGRGNKYSSNLYFNMILVSTTTIKSMIREADVLI